MGQMKSTIIKIALVLIVICGVVWFLFFRERTTMNEIDILPAGFKGVVLIIHDQKDGADIIKKDGKIIYRIPESVILKTKAPLTTGLKQTKYYYEKKGKRIELRYVWDYKKIPFDTVCVYGGSTGTNGYGDKAVDFTMYLVSTRKEADSLSKVAEQMHPLE